MKAPFIHDDFLLPTPSSRALYHDVAKSLLIIDYHCHLDARTLAEDRRFHSLTELWVTSDPYKHRAMRIAGVPESEITGNAPDTVKFKRWAETVPDLIGNPLHHWTALELSRYFGINEPLNPQSAESILERCNARLAGPEGSARALLESRNVDCVCTSDSLCDDLSHHATLAASGFKVRVLPSLRSDDITAVHSPDYALWLARLAECSGMKIDSWATFSTAVQNRLDAFDALGCRLADHALDDFTFTPTGETLTAILWERRLTGSLNAEETQRLKSGLLCWLGGEYAKRNWALQLHLGAQRTTSTRLRRLAGPAGGYAGMGNVTDIRPLCAFLDELEQHHRLPKIILYTLNPALNAALATLTGSFAEDGIRSKIQFGPAWWHNDHFSGITNHLDTLSSHGLLATFIGMTTDSRSLLSMVRHEYFRRTLCQWLGRQIESGFLPNDEPLLQRLVTNLCHDNAAHWIFPKPQLHSPL